MLRAVFSIIFLSVVAADSTNINTCYNDSATLQLLNFKQKNKGCPKCLTTSGGAPVNERDTVALNGDLMQNTFLVEDYMHIVSRKIPERTVHPAGAGAYGYFQVTHNITQYCKAKMFSHIGKRTPLFVRFSPATLDKGAPDIISDVRGFATKFYTEDGIFDIIGLSTEIFFFRDPILFSATVKSGHRNPVTNIYRDDSALWDVIWLKPEFLPFYLYLFGVIATPDGYIHMPGFSVQPYQLYNESGIPFYVRWHKIPKCGVKNLSRKEVMKIASMDSAYSARQIYNAIAEGDYPTYTLGIQIITKKQIDENPGFNFFDLTKLWSKSKYPVIPVGDIVLDRNPDNYFASVEQAAFCPSNVVPGIEGCPDNVFVARTFAYRAAQNYRLGVNHNHIAVNRPFREYTYDRDGPPPTGANGGSGPSYFPNSYNGPVPCKEKNKPKMIKIKQFDDSPNFDQISEIYKEFSNEQRNEMAQNIASSLGKANKGLQANILKLLGVVDTDLKFRVSMILATNAETCEAPKRKSKVTVDGKTYMCPFSN